jgi:hypothetical protein
MMKTMKLPEAIREQFQSYGRDGGHARAARMSPDARRSVARLAAIRRWTQERFGASHFETLGLPGGELIDAGLRDLAFGRESVESLLISLAAPRLTREGVPVPRNTFNDAETRLYRLLERSNEALAHARYNALRRQVVSFADACSHARRSEG